MALCEGDVVDLHELAVFVQVYEAGSFAAASRGGFISRQALSKTIARLEGELGPLFERLPRGLAPTELGRVAYLHARRMLEERAALEELARSYAAGHAGTLSLTLESNAAMTLPVGLLGSYASSRPGVSLSTRVLPADMTLSMLLTGSVDAVVAGPPRKEDGLAFEPILSGELVIVFSSKLLAGDDRRASVRPAEEEGSFMPTDFSGAPLSAADSLPDAGPIISDLSFLAGKTIFGVSPSNPVERALSPFLESRGIRATIAYDRPDTALATSEMEAGLGGVIVERLGARLHFGTVDYVHVPLEGPDAPAWSVGAVFRPDSPAAPIARDFAAFARTYVGGGPDVPVSL